MRLAFVAGALGLSLVGIAAQHSPPATEPAPSSTAAAVDPSAASAVSSDAAVKHAKRTACLKDAKTKKLVGADKVSFLKNCIAAS
jgi:hypothetical protein